MLVLFATDLKMTKYDGRYDAYFHLPMGLRFVVPDAFETVAPARVNIASVAVAGVG